MLLTTLAIIIAILILCISVFLSITDGDIEPLLLLWLIPFTFIIWIIAVAILGSIVPSERTYDQYDLKRLSDTSQTEGNYFIGTGGTSDTPKFYYYTHKDGMSKLNEVNADEAEIYETEESPYVIKSDRCEGDFEWLVDCVVWGEHVKFYIPPGSIKESHDLDL